LVNLGIFKRKQPWRDALIACTGLSVFVLAASRLWATGHHEWAFVLVFTATWLLLSISWSNVDFTEKSGEILARLMDHNFDRTNERIGHLERELAELKAAIRIAADEVTAHNGSGFGRTAGNISDTSV
jgi:hypothetical protein